MNAITQEINLNLIPGAIPPRISVSQYDDASRTLVFRLYNGAVSFAPGSSVTAQIRGTKPDNKGFEYAASIAGSTVTAAITEQMTAVAGDVRCEIVLKDSTKTIGTGNFVLEVERAALGEDTDISETVIPDIIDAAEANAERAEAAAAIAEAADLHPPYIGENDNWYVFDVSSEQYVDSGVDARGDDGEDGTSIANITKTGSAGLVDTYTVTLTDGTTYTFTVTNGQNGTDGQDGQDGADGEDGVGIADIEKTSTVGLVDTYTITLTDGTTYTFTVTNGQNAIPGGGTTGQVLTKLSDTSGDAGWQDPASGSSSLADLSDTTISSPTAAQPLTYDATNSKWINGGIIPAANGGTGNSSGYIRAGIRNNTTVGNRATAEGSNNQSSADDSHAEGASNNATGNQSHAEGYNNTASGNYSHAEGANTTASGYYAHAEGMISRATHNYAHAEGCSVASAQAAHSEGEGSTASAFCAHAGGNYGAASGSCSFSHGSYTNATAECSVAMGRNTNAGYVDQFAIGKYNNNKSTNIFEIGNGADNNNRSNALELDTSGNLNVASAITSGGNIVSNGFIDDGHGHRLGYSKRSKIDPFPEGASAITLYNTNGVTISSSSITGGVGSLTATESQAGYEGFVIELNVTPGKLHAVSFDYQNVDCEYWTNPTYMLGWTLDNSAKTDYQNIGLWSNNIERNAISQHFEGTITPGGNKVYLNFNVCGYSDSRSNSFSLSNLTVYELVEDTGEPDALSDLSDTAISSPADGQILGYNGTSGKWENTTLTIPDISVKQNITLTTPLSIGGVSRTTVESALGALAGQASYLEQTVTLSTSASTTVTFTDTKITATSFIEYACSQWDLVPESITAAAGSCTIVLPKVDSAQSVTVRIYVR